MTHDEYGNLKPGDKVIVTRGNTSYDYHFGIGDVLTIAKISDGCHGDELFFESCPREYHKCIRHGICGDWGVYENFTLYFQPTAEELANAGDMTKPVDPEELKSLYM